MPKVLITGATGALGPSVARAFLDAGYSVRAMSRTGGIPRGLEGLIEVFAGDITKADDVAGAVRDADIVVHLAALLHARPGVYTHGDYHRTNVAATDSLVAHARAAGVTRFVFASSICVYGGCARGVMDEQTVVQPETSYGRTKLDGEKVVLAATDLSGQQMGVVLRLAAVYGPGVKGNYLRLLRALQTGVAVRIGSGRNRRTLISEWDAGRAFVAAATHPVGRGRLYNVSDGEVHTLNHIVGMMQAALQKKTLMVALPYPIARWAAKLTDSGLRLLGIPPMAALAIDKYVEDIAVESSRIRTELGFCPQVELGIGWRRTIAGLNG